MNLLSKILVVLFLSQNILIAEIEKIANLCGEKICFTQWPKLPKINSWEHKRKISLHYSMNIYTPIGYTFSNADSVIYARAISKEKVNFDSLEKFIENDISTFIKNKPEVVISDVELTNGLNMKYFKSLKFFSNGSYEQVVYSEENDEKGNGYFILFTLTSFNEKAYIKSFPIFQEILLKYKKY